MSAKRELNEVWGCLIAIHCDFALHRMANYIYTPEEARYYSEKLFGYISSGVLKINIHKQYPFTTEGAQTAHRDLTTKGGSTIGKLLYNIGGES